MMKAFIFILSAISLATAFPTNIDTPTPDQAASAAPRALSFRTVAQTFEPRGLQAQTDDRGGGQADDFSFNVNGGYRPDNITDITDKYLYRLSIDKFEVKRNRRQPRALDWSSDGCTKAPDNPFGYNFLPACHRHDFGLQNYRKQGRLNERTKRPIDDQFYKDLKNECATHTLEIICKVFARTFYEVLKRNDPDKILV